jgi:hypothetical protein
MTLFPPFYPAEYGNEGTKKEPEEIPYYRNIEYEDYTVKPVDKVTIRMNDEDSGVVYGTGTNNYIIQGNMFTKNRDKEELLYIAEIIYDQIKNITFTPFTATNNGLPWLECGKDIVSYAMYDFVASAKQGRDVYVTKQFYILNRTLEGIQELKDTYSVKGEEYQSEFITDIQMQIDSVKETLEETARKEAQKHSYSKDETYSKEEIDELLNNLIISVSELPANPDPNKYYAIWEDE